jgi:hypothetical protein
MSEGNLGEKFYGLKLESLGTMWKAQLMKEMDGKLDFIKIKNSWFLKEIKQI